VINKFDHLHTGCTIIGQNQVNWWYTILCKQACSTKGKKTIYQLRECQLSNMAYILDTEQLNVLQVGVLLKG